MSPMMSILPHVVNSATLVNGSAKDLSPSVTSRLSRYLDHQEKLEELFIKLEKACEKHYNAVCKYLAVQKEFYDLLQNNDHKKDDLDKVSQYIDIKEQIKKTKGSIRDVEELISSFEKDRPQVVNTPKKTLIELNTLNALLYETDWLITVLIRQKEPSTGAIYSVQELIDTL